MGMFAASVALVRKSDVLLIQRARPPSAGYWTLPGGRLEAGETAEGCAAREIREELGLTVYGLRPVQVIDVRGRQLQVFATEGFEGEIVPDAAEVRQWRWVGLHHLAGLRTTLDLGEVLRRVMRLYDRT
jgi:ADP-ribose pyrophosphatase YjhB (NUDIX family)